MKWAGAAIIIAISYILGRMIASEEAERARACDSMMLLLSYMRRRISSERTPIFDIFSSFSDPYLEECGFLPTVRSHRVGSGTLWSTATESLPLPVTLKNELSHFGNELGSLTLDEQIRRIDGCIDLLSDERGRLREELPKKQKSIRSFWLLAGTLAAIVLF